MTAPPPRRPWRKRKRTWAAVAVWLIVAYPASAIPVGYAIGRGWLPLSAGHLYPAPSVSPYLTGETPPVGRWGYRWFELGRDHAASD